MRNKVYEPFYWLFKPKILLYNQYGKDTKSKQRYFFLIYLGNKQYIYLTYNSISYISHLSIKFTLIIINSRVIWNLKLFDRIQFELVIKEKKRSNYTKWKNYELKIYQKIKVLCQYLLSLVDYKICLHYYVKSKLNWGNHTFLNRGQS